MRGTIRKILVTGGAGFIGSEFVRQGVKRGYRFVVVDSLTYAGDILRGSKKFLKISSSIRLIFVPRRKLEVLFFTAEKFDGLVHFAAETHVDRSLKDNAPFIRTNILGTQNLIDLSLKYGLK